MRESHRPREPAGRIGKRFLKSFCAEVRQEFVAGAFPQRLSAGRIPHHSCRPEAPPLMNTPQVDPAPLDANTSLPLTYEVDDYDLESFLRVAERFAQDRFAYVVTPNVDHLIRLHDDATFRQSYSGAEFVLLDSRFAATVLRIQKGLHLRVCTGADLTAALFARVARPLDRILVIGGSAAQAASIAMRYGLQDLQHHNPPMGFIRDDAAVDACLAFVEANSPFRFCFLAVGSPQQEAIAHALLSRGRARGLALCIGASINFITGAEIRAPQWMQRLSLEWLFRLLQNPRRLFYRYVIRGPRVFGYLRNASVTVRHSASSAQPDIKL